MSIEMSKSKLRNEENVKRKKGIQKEEIKKEKRKPEKRRRKRENSMETGSR